MDKTRSQQLRGGAGKYNLSNWLRDEGKIMFGVRPKGKKGSRWTRRGSRDSIGSPVLSKLHGKMKYSPTYPPPTFVMPSPKLTRTVETVAPRNLSRYLVSSPAKATQRNFRLPTKPVPTKFSSLDSLELPPKPRPASPANQGVLSPAYSVGSPPQSIKQRRKRASGQARELKNLEIKMVQQNPTGSRRTQNSRKSKNI